MTSEVIYRFVSFYDLYSLLEDKKLRVSRATEFDDKNEGFGFVLRELDLKFLAAFGAPTYFDGPDIVKTLSYISCWTTKPDKIAMWLLYSKDKDGFRIRTTRTKLESVVAKYRNAYAANPDIREFSPKENGNIFDVNYVNFSDAKVELQKRNKEIEREIQNLPDALSKAEIIRAYSKIAKETMAALKFKGNPWSFKDEAYDHEHEVRAVLEFEASNEESYSLISDKEEFKKFAASIPISVNMIIPDNFLEDICIDMRCPSFKKAVFGSFLSKYGFSLSESQSFSSLFDE